MTAAHSNQGSAPHTPKPRLLDRRLDRNAQAAAVLALAGAASALCLWLFFVQPVSLLEFQRQPLLDLYKLTPLDPAARPRVIIGYVILGALYGLGWWAAQRTRGRAAWAIVLGSALASSAVLLFLYPFGAADIFDNIMHGRILGVHGANPFQDVARQFPSDPFYLYVAWKRSPSAYGPAWELLAGGMAWITQETLRVSEALRVSTVIANVLAFKLVGVAFLAGSVGVVAAILRRQAPERALAGVVLLAWNPVVLVETVGQGHNDIAMVFWVLAAAWALTGRRYTLAVLALVMGALVKFLPVLMLPAALAIALREMSTLSACANGSESHSRITHHVSRFTPHLRFLLVTGLAAAAVIAIAYAPFWRGLETLSIERRQGLLTSSLPAAAWAILQGSWDQQTARERISLVAAGMTALFALWQAVRAWRDGDWLSFPRAAFNILMFYLLLTCLWFQNWYAIWPLGLAALLPVGFQMRLAVFFSFATLAKPLVFEPFWLWQQPMPPKAWRELRLGPAVMLLPWLYVLYTWLQARLPRRRSTPPGANP